MELSIKSIESWIGEKGVFSANSYAIYKAGKNFILVAKGILFLINRIITSKTFG